jgi:hypothetical protein
MTFSRDSRVVDAVPKPPGASMSRIVAPRGHAVEGQSEAEGIQARTRRTPKAGLLH